MRTNNTDRFHRNDTVGTPNGFLVGVIRSLQNGRVCLVLEIFVSFLSFNSTFLIATCRIRRKEVVNVWGSLETLLVVVFLFFFANLTTYLCSQISSLN